MAGITFLGAARNVTGSRFLVESKNGRVLVDCGLYQERDLVDRNWEPFPVPPGSIDAVLLTHAHLDHCGYLPRLLKDGFSGPVICTEPTEAIARIVLLDSARIQEEDVAYKQRRHRQQGRKSPHSYEPLYTVTDAEAVFPRFKACSYDSPVPVIEGITVFFRDAGHILGSAIIEMKIREDGRERTVVFSGDLGRYGTILLSDPSVIERADCVLVEATYGDREHEATDQALNTISEIFEATRRAGGNILIPSFAIERAQEILYHMDQLLNQDRIPHLVTFLDSPMAIKVTEVYRRFTQYLNPLAVENGDGSLFDFPLLQLTRSAEESKAINHIKGSAVIIAGSGMCTGGRIKHHLIRNISRPESCILFVGYQAVGTLGRHILRRPPEVRIFGSPRLLKARVEQINGLSAHAGRSELLRWMDGFTQPPEKIFVIHGEEKAAEAFVAELEERFPSEIKAPAFGETCSL